MDKVKRKTQPRTNKVLINSVVQVPHLANPHTTILINTPSGPPKPICTARNVVLHHAARACFAGRDPEVDQDIHLVNYDLDPALVRCLVELMDRAYAYRDLTNSPRLIRIRNQAGGHRGRGRGRGRGSGLRHGRGRGHKGVIHALGGLLALCGILHVDSTDINDTIVRAVLRAAEADLDAMAGFRMVRTAIEGQRIPVGEEMQEEIRKAFDGNNGTALIGQRQGHLKVQKKRKQGTKASPDPLVNDDVRRSERKRSRTWKLKVEDEENEKKGHG